MNILMCLLKLKMFALNFEYSHCRYTKKYYLILQISPTL